MHSPGRLHCHCRWETKTQPPWQPSERLKHAEAVLLTALDIPFTEKLQLFKPGQRQPAFAAFSPTAKVPCLHDHSAGDAVVWDSLAIVEYLAERHPAVWPAAPAARAWARCAAAEMHSSFAAIRDECSMNVAL
ncbi:Glutathione S-transferase-like protein, partial [Tolypocladium paradoxum]